MVRMEEKRWKARTESEEEGEERREWKPRLEEGDFGKERKRNDLMLGPKLVEGRKHKRER